MSKEDDAIKAENELLRLLSKETAEAYERFYHKRGMTPPSIDCVIDKSFFAYVHYLERRGML